nr:formylglycine-generating enzyme family protein [uncultured Psychroserpens sp.]
MTYAINFFVLQILLLVTGFHTSEMKEDAVISKTKLFNLAEGVEVKMIWVEPGTFIMGSPNDELGRIPEKEKQHKVVITKGYWLAETELTQLQWQKVMHNNPSFNKGDNLPVDQVSYLDVEKFLAIINSKNQTFRLPTEAEWEYACRAGSTKAYATTNKDNMVWHSGNSGRESHPVAQKKT